MNNMPSEQASTIAAQCWCDPRTSHCEMDVALAEVFAEKINEMLALIGEGYDDIRNDPWDRAVAAVYEKHGLTLP